MIYSIENDQLTIGNKTIALPLGTRPKIILEWQQLIVVLFWTNDQNFTDTNVYAYDFHGERVWTIEDIGDVRKDYFNPFSNISVDEQGRLIAYNVVGFEYIVSEIDGTITRLSPGARPW